MNRTRPGRAGFARQDKGRVTKKVDRLAAVVDPRDVAWTLPREYQVSADSRIEEVELVVRPEGDQTAVRPDGPTRNDSARLSVGTNVERLHQSGQRNLTACIRTAPMPSIDAVQSNRTSTPGSLADEIHRGIARRYIDRFYIMCAVRVPHAQHGRRPARPERVARALRWLRLGDRIHRDERPLLEVVSRIAEIDAGRGVLSRPRLQQEWQRAGAQGYVFPIDRLGAWHEQSAAVGTMEVRGVQIGTVAGIVVRPQDARKRVTDRDAGALDEARALKRRLQ